jgi:hypothetical protein
MNMPGMPKMDVDIALRGPAKHSGVLYPVSAASRRGEGGGGAWSGGAVLEQQEGGSECGERN